MTLVVNIGDLCGFKTIGAIEVEIWGVWNKEGHVTKRVGGRGERGLCMCTYV